MKFEVGVMIEVPRAALVAKQLVDAGVDFFSFGTNGRARGRSI
jgi:phosphoenolpyruvate-protein kinase (PTS system EI component)